MLYAFVNGRIERADKASISVFDRGFVLGDGLFETLRCRSHVPQFFHLHYQRLARSAKRLRIPLPWKEDELARTIVELTRRSRLEDSVVRITLTRGRYTGGLTIDPKAPPTIVVTVQAVSGLPEELYERGVAVAITSINKEAASGVDARIKSTNYLANIFAKAEAEEKGCYEGILLGHKGDIAELSTASFFCVLGDKVVTPPIDAGILPGITRQVVLQELRRKGVGAEEKTIYPASIPMMQEAFLTSSVRGPVPIHRINRRRIGSGRPGEVYALVKALYAKACEREEAAARKKLGSRQSL